MNDLPTTLVRDLTALPLGSGAVLLLRHGRRGDLPPNEPGDLIPLTTAGRVQSAALGKWLGTRIGTVRSSPVLRCRQTAEAILVGAGCNGALEVDSLLGAPGPFVVDGDMAWPHFLRFGSRLLARLQLAAVPLAGMRPVEEGCALLLRDLLARPVRPGKVDLRVTHDLIIVLLAGHLLHVADPDALWPDFLEGILLRQEGQEVIGSYQGRVLRVRCDPMAPWVVGYL